MRIRTRDCPSSGFHFTGAAFNKAPPVGSFVVRAGDTCLTLHADGAFLCSCGSDDAHSHADDCKAPWWARVVGETAATVWRLSKDMHAVAHFADEAFRAAGCVALLSWIVGFWNASPAGQLAARDAAVAKACAEVPEGCDPGRWRTVVHKVAAQQWEYNGEVLFAHCFAELLDEHLGHVRGPVGIYGRARAWHYSPGDAAARAVEPGQWTIAIGEALDVYEGRHVSEPR